MNGVESPLGGAAENLACFGNRESGTSWTDTVIPVAGVIRNLRVSLRFAPGSGKSRTFTVWNASTAGAWSATSLACTISNTDTEGSDMSSTVIISAPAGSPLKPERIEIRETVSGAPANSYVWFCLDWIPTTADETILCTHTDTNKLSSATLYLPLFGGIHSAAATSGAHRSYIPTAGTISDLAVVLSHSPSTGIRKTRTFEIRKNGSLTGVKVTISRTAITGVDQVHSFTVADGDYIDVIGTTLSGPDDSWVSIGVVFKPDVADQFVFGHARADIGGFSIPTGTTNRYMLPMVGDGAWSSSIHAARNLFQEYRITKMRARISQLPNVGGSWILDAQGGSGSKPNIVWTSASASEQVVTAAYDFGVDALAHMRVQAFSVTASLPYTKANLVYGCLFTPIPPDTDLPWPISPMGVLQA